MRHLEINHWLNVKWWMMVNYPNFKYLPTFKAYINQVYEQLHADFMASRHVDSWQEGVEE